MSEKLKKDYPTAGTSQASLPISKSIIEKQCGSYFSNFNHSKWKYSLNFSQKFSNDKIVAPILNEYIEFINEKMMGYPDDKKPLYRVKEDSYDDFQDTLEKFVNENRQEIENLIQKHINTKESCQG